MDCIGNFASDRVLMMSEGGGGGSHYCSKKSDDNCGGVCGQVFFIFFNLLCVLIQLNW